MADVSPLSADAVAHADPQIAAAKEENEGLKSTVEAGIVGVKEDEDVFADAPEAPIDDQNRVLVDKGDAFVAGVEGGDVLVDSTETAALVDGEFQTAELVEGAAEVEDGTKGGVLGGEESETVDSSSAVQNSEERGVAVEGDEKDDNLRDLDRKTSDSSSSDSSSSGGSSDPQSSKMDNQGDEVVFSEAVVEENENSGIGDEELEASAAEIGADTNSVIDQNKVENFEEAVASIDEGTVDVEKVENEAVNGVPKEDIPNDFVPNEEGFLEGEGDAIINATKGAENGEESVEATKDVRADDLSKENNLLQENSRSLSFESADSDENGSEEKKDTPSDVLPKEESLLLQEQANSNVQVDSKEEKENSAAGSEQEKSDAGNSENAPDELTAVNNLSVETEQAAVESETLATDGVDAVSIQDRQLTPTLAEDTEKGAIGLHLAPSSVGESASVTGTETKEVNGVSSNVEDDNEAEEMLDAMETAEELEDDFPNNSPYSLLESSNDVDGQIASDSDVEAESDEENSDKEMIDADALAALLKAASSSAHDGGLRVTSQDGNRIFMVDRPAGLGSSIPSLRPAPPRSTRSNLSASETAMTSVPDNDVSEEEKILHEKVELIKVKFLRLVQRLGHSPEDTVAAQVLYRLSLAEGIRHGRQTNRAFSLESAKKKALQLEAEGKEALDFSCTILVVGKSGVGKSATINSIFGGEKSLTNAFIPATDSVKEITGIVDGVKVRVIDTPGLRVSMMDQSSNRKVLLEVKKYTKKCPPDIVLYVDRMDTQTRDMNDLPLLKTITSTLGPSIWFNAIVALTHAASAPPDGPSGAPLSYEVYVAQRSHVIQQSIRLAAGDMRLMNPVALVENHQSCRKNREGQKVLPNGLAWRPQMLLLCYSSKILSEANSLLKLQDPSPKNIFGFRYRSPPLPFLLSSLLQSKPHPKLTPEQGGDAVDSDVDLDDLSDSDQEDEEEEYDQLPPFKPLSKAQIAKLTKEQRKAYFDEFEYRVKLLQKKQWKDELRRMKELKKGGKKVEDDFAYGDPAGEFEQDSAPATVPVPLPDMVLPPSFDCEAPTYRYRFLEPTSHLLARPVLDTHGWDHDCGYDGISLEESLAIASRFPAVVSAQITKDKKEFSIHVESSVAAKHGENGSSLAGFNIQAVGKQLAYTLLGETKFKNFKKNKTAGGISVTFLGETVATGLKVEDQLSIGKRVSLVTSAGAVRSQNDTAYGANLEARLRDKEYPIGQTITTLGLSLMRWHSDLALGANLQSQFSIGRNSKMAVRVGLNNKLTGQITVKTSSSEQLQLALVGIIPVAISIYRSLMGGME